MNASRSRGSGTSSPAGESIPQQPQVPPISHGSDMSPFIWQQLGEIQKSLGALQASVSNMETSLNSSKAKVDTLLELKNKAIGAMWVIGIVVGLTSGLVAWSANKIWNAVSAVTEPAIRASLSNPTPAQPGPSVPAPTAPVVKP